VGFACSTWTRRVMSKTCLWHDDILTPFHPFAARQFLNLHLVQGRDCLEVKAVPLPPLIAASSDCRATGQRMPACAGGGLLTAGNFAALIPLPPSRRVNTPARQRAGHCAAMAREATLDHAPLTVAGGRPQIMFGGERRRASPIRSDGQGTGHDPVPLPPPGAPVCHIPAERSAAAGI